jgi:hypothetical protein
LFNEGGRCLEVEGETWSTLDAPPDMGTNKKMPSTRVFFFFFLTTGPTGKGFGLAFSVGRRRAAPGLDGGKVVGGCGPCHGGLEPFHKGTLRPLFVTMLARLQKKARRELQGACKGYNGVPWSPVKGQEMDQGNISNLRRCTPCLTVLSLVL